MKYENKVTNETYKTARPDYCVSSLDNQLNNIRGLYLRTSIDQIKDQLIDALRGPAQAYSDQEFKTDYNHPFWRYEGTPRIIEALEEELVLARFKLALEGPVAYVTTGHKVSPNRYHIYYRDATSPSSVSSAPGSPCVKIDNSYVCQEVEKMLTERKLIPCLSQSYTKEYR